MELLLNMKIQRNYFIKDFPNAFDRSFTLEGCCDKPPGLILTVNFLEINFDILSKKSCYIVTPQK